MKNYIVLKDTHFSLIGTTPYIEPAPRYNSYSFTLGLSLGNNWEFNEPSGSSDKVTLAFNSTFDFVHKYSAPASIFTCSNELHYIFGIQKKDVSANNFFQRTQDKLQTLHDYAFSLTKLKKWHVNLILKTDLPLFTVFDGDYFSDFDRKGKINAFASPYNFTVSPGFKYTPTQSLRISISPYSALYYGVLNTEVSNKGLYIKDKDENGNYKQIIRKSESVEMNIWYDERVKDWLTLQYRFDIRSSYAGGLFQSGSYNGLFITRVKIIKNIMLSHRLNVENKLTNDFLKPYIKMYIELSYTMNL